MFKSECRGVRGSAPGNRGRRPGASSAGAPHTGGATDPGGCCIPGLITGESAADTTLGLDVREAVFWDEVDVWDPSGPVVDDWLDWFTDEELAELAEDAVEEEDPVAPDPDVLVPEVLDELVLVAEVRIDVAADPAVDCLEDSPETGSPAADDTDPGGT